MRDYSFRYLDAHGRTQASDYCQLMDNEAAIAFGRECLSRSNVVEVWAGNKLIITLKAECEASGPHIATSITIEPRTGDAAIPIRRHPPAAVGADIVALPPWTRAPIR